MGIFHRLAGREFQTDGVMKLKDFKQCSGIVKNFHLKKKLFEQCKWRPGLHMLIAGPMVIKSRLFRTIISHPSFTALLPNWTIYTISRHYIQRPLVLPFMLSHLKTYSEAFSFTFHAFPECLLNCMSCSFHFKTLYSEDFSFTFHAVLECLLQCTSCGSHFKILYWEAFSFTFHAVPSQDIILRGL